MKMIMKANKKSVVARLEDGSLHLDMSIGSLLWRFRCCKSSSGQLLIHSGASNWAYFKCICWNSTIGSSKLRIG